MFYFRFKLVLRGKEESEPCTNLWYIGIILYFMLKHGFLFRTSLCLEAACLELMLKRSARYALLKMITAW